MKAVLLAAGCLVFAACGESECQQLPTSFELVVDVDDDLASARSLVVTLENEGDRWRRSYELEADTLADGVTSLAVQIDPDRSVETDIDVSVDLHEGPGGMGRLLASEKKRFDLSPNGCNTFMVELEES